MKRENIEYNYILYIGVMVTDDGKVSGIGTHNELYKNNEIYKSLYEKELRREND